MKVIVKIKDVTGTISKFTVDKEPVWKDGLIYVVSTNRSEIIYNIDNVVSYSTKKVDDQPRLPKYEVVEDPNSKQVSIADVIVEAVEEAVNG